MKPSPTAWLVGVALILFQACCLVEALPLDRHLLVQTPTHASVGKRDTIGDQGFYNVKLQNDARPTAQPFFPGISYLIVEDCPGAIHPQVPHLDTPCESRNSTSEKVAFCVLENGNLCPGVPHIDGTPAQEQGHLKDSPVRIPLATSAGIPVPQITMANQDIFLPISKDSIPSNIPSRGDHPVEVGHVVNANGPISTNKFYANFFLGTQTNYTFTHPYAVGWSKANGAATSSGMAISHIEADKKSFGDPSDSLPGNPARYYINPVGIKSVVLSATELGGSTTLSLSKPLAFSAEAILQPQSGSKSSITFPVVQGMGFVTGIYKNLQPVIQSGVFFRKVDPAGGSNNGIFKYRATLEDNTTWLLYVAPDNGADPKMELISNAIIRGPTGFSGTIQVAKNPSGEAGERVYDQSAGVYATAVTVSGTVNNDIGSYTFRWEKAGKDAPLLTFAMPHHVESFDDATKGRKTGVKLTTTTKGNATAYTGESWTMVESNLPIDMDFAPWQPGKNVGLSEAAKQFIRNVAPAELAQNMPDQTNLNSMYFSGKALNKFAGLVYTVHELAQDSGLAANALQSLKECFGKFVQNKQVIPLVYDTVWKGVVSTGTYETGDSGLDFGNTLYNDHHFHYGYFVLAAAIIGRLDPAWTDANKAWVNMLIRDAANPSADDPSFPFSRGFDWFHGHSWAKGLFESLDGKDEESTSEDTMFAYAIKMWGRTTGDASMEARGNLMLGILTRSLNNYFLMKKSNVNQPPNFIGNKVTGILFENKVDHATYFGSNLEYIHGIHMLPLLPNSVYSRSKEFVQEEWDAIFAPGASTPAEAVRGGWKGVLFANLALIDPNRAWNFFSRPDFNLEWIDGGASRAWYLAFAAGLGGGPK